MGNVVLAQLIAVSIALSACAYDPRIQDCAVRCSAAAPECPEGFVCSFTQNLCRSYVENSGCPAGCPAAYWTGPLANWSEARVACEANGGHLVVIDEMTENDEVVLLAAGLHVWIGYTDAASEGAFAWIEGTSAFTHWATGEPNNAGAGGTDEDCAFLHAEINSAHVPSGMTGYWTDIACNTPIAYVCECRSP